MRGDTKPSPIATLEPSVSFLGGKMLPRGRWRPRGAYLRGGERLKVMPSEAGCTFTDHRPSPAITAELLLHAEPQAEELLSQQPGRA